LWTGWSLAASLGNVSTREGVATLELYGSGTLRRNAQPTAGLNSSGCHPGPRANHQHRLIFVDLSTEGLSVFPSGGYRLDWPGSVAAY
jgi:hypothetical protein